MRSLRVAAVLYALVPVLALGSRAVLVTSVLISLLVTFINVALRRVLSRSVIPNDGKAFGTVSDALYNGGTLGSSGSGNGRPLIMAGTMVRGSADRDDGNPVLVSIVATGVTQSSVERLRMPADCRSAAPDGVLP